MFYCIQFIVCKCFEYIGEVYKTLLSNKELNLYQRVNFETGTDDKLCIAMTERFVCERVENIFGKGENDQHFLLFQKCFLLRTFSEGLK